MVCRIRTRVVSTNSSRAVKDPSVAPSAISIYEQYVRRGKIGAGLPTKHDLRVYQQYVSSAYR